LTTQIIAANSDVNQLRENLQRYKSQLAQYKLIQEYLDEAKILVSKTYDGLILANQLLELESSFRSKIPKDDYGQIEVLDQLHLQILLVQTRFTKALEANTAPISKKPGMIKSTAIGSVAALFLMLMILLTQRMWSYIKLSGDELKCQ
jgi:hypothetical protein